MSAASKLSILFLACLLSSAAPASPSHSRVVFGDNQAKHLLGLKVENQDGILLGKIKNFVIDTSSGQVVYALISSGGGLTGIGAKTLVIPSSNLAPTTAKRGVACVPINPRSWDRLPLFKKSELAKLADYDRYRAAFASAGLTFPARVTSLSPTGQTKPAKTPAHPSLALATSLFGDEVSDSQGKSLGDITDILIDFPGSQQAIAITLTGNWLRSGQPLAIPLRSLQPAGNNKFKTRKAVASVANAPVLTPELWDKRTASDSQIYRFAAK